MWLRPSGGLTSGRGGSFFRARFGRMLLPRLVRGAFAFDVGFAALAFRPDSMLLTHAAVAIGRNEVGRNLQLSGQGER
jgi:hypothetical protein